MVSIVVGCMFQSIAKDHEGVLSKNKSMAAKSHSFTETVNQETITQNIQTKNQPKNVCANIGLKANIILSSLTCITLH